MLAPVRAWSFAFVLLFGCARSALPIELESTAEGDRSTDAGEALDATLTVPAKCPTPDAPVSLPEGCEAEMCACDPQAFSDCNWDCWSKVACQVATCNNNPTRIECAEGCASATPAELSLGRCYEASRACTRFRRRR